MDRSDAGDLRLLAAHGIERRSGAAVIIDVVASVRRIETAEVATVVGWVDTLNRVVAEVLPAHGGRLVKSLGDGALIEFAASLEAVRAALAIQEMSVLPLRIGIEAGDFLSDSRDIYGRAVNRAARLMTLLEGAGIVVSDRVRAAVSADLDAAIEDLGLQLLKNIDEPVRVFRLGPAQPIDKVDGDVIGGPMLPSLAVIPFTPADPGQNIPAAGDILCEEIIRALSASPHLRIISRLSTTRFRDRRVSPQDISRRLNARFLLVGTYRVEGSKFRLTLDMVDGRSGATIWSKFTAADVGDVYAGTFRVLYGVAESVTRAIISRETRLAKQGLVSNLENHTLLLAAVSYTHSLDKSEFALADRLFGELDLRQSENGIVHAWRAHWFNFRSNQGWSQDSKSDGALARLYSQKALDRDPQSSLALAISSFICTVVDRQVERGAALADQALGLNPNDPFAWIFRSVNRLFNDDGTAAVFAAERARSLAPLDPARFLFDSIAASASFVAGNFTEAERLASISYQANRLHASTVRVHAASLWMLGRTEDARRKGFEIRTLEPELTVSSWLRRSPAADNRVGREFARCLKAVGIPE